MPVAFTVGYAERNAGAFAQPVRVVFDWRARDCDGRAARPGPVHPVVVDRGHRPDASSVGVRGVVVPSEVPPVMYVAVGLVGSIFVLRMTRMVIAWVRGTPSR